MYMYMYTYIYIYIDEKGELKRTSKQPRDIQIYEQKEKKIDGLFYYLSPCLINTTVCTPLELYPTLKATRDEVDCIGWPMQAFTNRSRKLIQTKQVKSFLYATRQLLKQTTINTPCATIMFYVWTW